MEVCGDGSLPAQSAVVFVRLAWASQTTTTALRMKDCPSPNFMSAARREEFTENDAHQFFAEEENLPNSGEMNDNDIANSAGEKRRS